MLRGEIKMTPKKPSAALSRRPSSLPDEAAVTLARHRAQCRICRHPRREEIEWEFLDWVPGREIAETYKLASARAVYRHAHALDLLRRRRGYVQRALDSIIERSGEAKITAGSVVSAVRLLVELNSADNRLRLEVLRRPLLPRGVAARQSTAAERDESGEEDVVREDREYEKRAAKSGYATGAAGRDRDDDDDDFDEASWADASPRLLRALQAAPAPAQAPPVAPAAPAPEKNERNAAAATNAWERSTEARAEHPKPATSPDPGPSKPPTPPVPEPGTRQEPDGPPQVAGMAWPWPKGRSPFARRGDWRRPVSG
jgi:hypothetical protein